MHIVSIAVLKAWDLPSFVAESSALRFAVDFGGAGKAAGGGGWVPRSAGWKLVGKWDFDGLKEEIDE